MEIFKRCLLESAVPGCPILESVINATYPYHIYGPLETMCNGSEVSYPSKSYQKGLLANEADKYVPVSTLLNFDDHVVPKCLKVNHMLFKAALATLLLGKKKMYAMKFIFKVKISVLFVS